MKKIDISFPNLNHIKKQKKIELKYHMEKSDIPDTETATMETKSAIITTMTTTTTLIPEFRFPYYVWRYIVYLSQRTYTDKLRLYPSMMSKIDYNMRPHFFVRGWWCGERGNKYLHANDIQHRRFPRHVKTKRAKNHFNRNGWGFFYITKVQRVSNKYYRVTCYTLKQNITGDNLYKISTICEGRKMIKESKFAYHNIPIKYGIDNHFTGSDHTMHWCLYDAIDIRSLENFKRDYVDKFNENHTQTNRLLNEIRHFYTDPHTPFGRIEPSPQ